MLVLGGHNQLGNVLHVIMGPESELHQDIHGAQILDITQLLAMMSGTDKVYLSLTRCRSEQVTAQIMSGSGVPYINSFTGTGTPGTPKVVTPQPRQDSQDPTVAPKQKCSYCSAEAELLPVDGFSICGSCAAIELGRRIKTRK